MLLNNYWLWKNYVDTHVVTNNLVNINIGLKNSSGQDVVMYYAWYNSDDIDSNANMKRRLGLAIGSGTTEPTTNDYWLATEIGNISDVTITSNTGIDGQTQKTILTYSGTNRNNTSITINEVVLYKDGRGMVSGVYESDYKIALIRQLLETPKTVPSGEGFSLTFEWVEQ